MCGRCHEQNLERFIMRKVVLFIAMSLDGYIADSKGKVDWLNGHSNNEENTDTYSVFIKDVDTVIMGFNTYHQVKTELSPEEWIYKDLTTYVITHRQLPPMDNIKFVQEAPCSIVGKLKLEEGRAIWICGGGNIIHPLVRSGLVDEYYISIIPTILGSGIRIFVENPNEVKLRLLRTQAYNGIVEVVYACR